MREEIKMGDVFNFPLQAAFNELAVIDNSDVVVAWVDNFFGENARDYFIEAINNHDRLTEENKRLREFLESLQLDVSNEIKLEQLLLELGGE